MLVPIAGEYSFLTNPRTPAALTTSARATELKPDGGEAELTRLEKECALFSFFIRYTQYIFIQMHTLIFLYLDTHTHIFSQTAERRRWLVSRKSA